MASDARSFRAVLYVLLGSVSLVLTTASSARRTPAQPAPGETTTTERAATNSLKREVPSDTPEATPDSATTSVQAATEHWEWMLVGLLTLGGAGVLVWLRRRRRAASPSSSPQRSHLRVGMAQDVGAREQQEDAFDVHVPDEAEQREEVGVLAVVADGMGGLDEGQNASQAAVETFVAAYTEEAQRVPPPAALRRAVDEANAAVHALCSNNRTAGSTLVAAAVRAEELHWISVGDSHIYLGREGRLTQLNTDHVFAHRLDEAAEQGLLSPDEAADHPEREALTSYLGMEEVPEIDQNMETDPLNPGDRVLLCSDGLYGSLSMEEMRRLLENPNPQAASDALIEATLSRARPRQDNVTALVLSYLTVPE